MSSRRQGAHETNNTGKKKNQRKYAQRGEKRGGFPETLTKVIERVGTSQRKVGGGVRASGVGGRIFRKLKTFSGRTGPN